MQAIIQAVEAVAALPAYQEVVLGYAPEIARYRPGPVGVFMGYDFHLGLDGPKLIEINTNAGGALINAKSLLPRRLLGRPLVPRGKMFVRSRIGTYQTSIRGIRDVCLLGKGRLIGGCCVEHLDSLQNAEKVVPRVFPDE